MEEVADDHVNGQPPALILPGHLQQLLLIPVAQLALPEAQTVFGHHGHGAGHGSIGVYQIGGRVAHGEPVVHLLGAVGLPLGSVLSEGHAAHGGVVPEEAVTPIRQHEGHGGLGVVVAQFQHTVLEVHFLHLILTHAIQPLVGRAFKGRSQMVVAAAQRLPATAMQLASAMAGGLLQQKLPVLIIVNLHIVEPRVIGDAGFQTAVTDGRFVAVHMNFRRGRFRRRGQQRPVLIQNIAGHPSPNAEAVRSPCANFDLFVLNLNMQRVSEVGIHRHSFSLRYCSSRRSFRLRRDCSTDSKGSRS